MSVHYDLEIIKAYRLLLLDNSNVSNLVGTRIYQEGTTSNKTFPQITLSVEISTGEGNLPVEHGELYIKGWFKRTSSSSEYNCRRLGNFVSSVVDRKISEINVKLGGTGINMRLCDKLYHLGLLVDDETKLYYCSLAFDISYKRLIQ